MSDIKQDVRLSDAAVALRKFRALDQVTAEDRTILVHDQIASAIEDICNKRQGNGRAPFTSVQIETLKDIAFQLVHILDAKNHRTPSGLSSILTAFSESSLRDKIAIVAGALAIIGSVSADVSVVTSSIHASRQEMTPAVAIRPISEPEIKK